METCIKAVASQFFKVDENAIHVKERLMGGMSNQVYIFKVAGEKYTFRIPGTKAEKFVNRKEEAAVVTCIEPLSLNNETLYLNTLTGHKIAKFVEGRPLSQDEHPASKLNEVVKLLKTLHQSSFKAPHDYKPFERLDTYESYTLTFDVQPSSHYQLLKEFLLSYKPYLESLPLVLCHNDSQISNMIIGDGTSKSYLLDWEFGGNNDYFYDLACVGNQDFALALQLLPLYLGHEPEDKDYERLCLWRLFQCLQWHNVATYKHLIGLGKDLGIPFDKVAATYLDKAQALKDAIETQSYSF